MNMSAFFFMVYLSLTLVISPAAFASPLTAALQMGGDVGGHGQQGAADTGDAAHGSGRRAGLLRLVMDHGRRDPGDLADLPFN